MAKLINVDRWITKCVFSEKEALRGIKVVMPALSPFMEEGSFSSFRGPFLFLPFKWMYGSVLRGGRERKTTNKKGSGRNNYKEDTQKVYNNAREANQHA